MTRIKVSAALSRARSAARRGDTDSAQSICRSVLESFPGNRRARDLLAELRAPTASGPPADVVPQDLVRLFESGDHAGAVRLAQSRLEKTPDSAPLWNIFGAALARCGHPDQAEAAFAQAIRLAPGYHSAHMNHGNVLLDLQRADEAISAYREALSLRPDFAEAHYNLGRAFQRLGQAEDACDAYRRALDCSADYPDATTNLWSLLVSMSRQTEAAQVLRDRTQVAPEDAQAWNNLGTLYYSQCLAEEAERAFRRATEIQPANPAMRHNLGLGLRALGAEAEAEEAFRAAVAADPSSAAAHVDLGNLLSDAGRLEEAAQAYFAALDADLENPLAHNNLGNVFKRLGRPEDAAACYERALAFDPAHAEANNNMAIRRWAEGDLPAAEMHFARALRARPEMSFSRAQMLHVQGHMCDWTAHDAFAAVAETLGVEGVEIPPFTMLAFEDSPERQKARSELYDRRRHRALLPPHKVVARPRRDRMRIGYFSSDLHNHATLHLMSGLLRHHDRARFEICAFSYGNVRDHHQQALSAGGEIDRFYDVQNLTDTRIAELAREQDLDIAIDLKGYTEGSRAGLMADRVAPVQISYLGYPGTLGAGWCDYIVADETVIPPAERSHYTEKVIFLPHCYQPNDNMRPVADLDDTRADHGLPEDAFVLCCFNQGYKISRAEFEIWMRILADIDHAVLWLMATNRWAEDNLRRAAELRGIDPDRLVFAPRLGPELHLARHRHADLFIDTFNVNAHTTASDALWVGLPVVTLPGRQFAARVAASLLGAVGLQDLAVPDAAAYESLVRDLAGNPERLSELRRHLAMARDTAPLFDTPRYARDFERGLDMAFARWAEGLAPADIRVGPGDTQAVKSS